MIADNPAFLTLIGRWRKQNILTIVILLAIGLLFFFGIRGKARVAGAVLYWVVMLAVFIRVYVITFFLQFNRINHIISSVEVNGQVKFSTFPISTLAGLIQRSPIDWDISKSELTLAQIPENSPLPKNVLRSDRNYSLRLGDEQYFLIRALFSDGALFDRTVDELKKS